MSLFQGSTRVVIEGGNFSTVGRDQHVSIVQCSHHRERRERTILDEYQEIPIGKVYLKQKIAETSVRTDERGWKNLDARRTIYLAEVSGEDKEKGFLHVKYSGRDACKAWKIDFDSFSVVKDSNTLQLFGYSRMNLLPALVFHDAFVPVSQIVERNHFSSALLTYFSYQAVVVQGLHCTLLCRELWLNPRTGSLHIGLVVPDNSNVIYDLVDLPTADEVRPSLSPQTYSNTNVLFEYLNGTLSTSDIIRGIRWFNQASLDYPNEEDAKSILSSLPGAVYHRASREIVAQYPEDNLERWYYEFVERNSVIPDALQGSAFTMDDGSVRFTLKPTDMGDRESFGLCYFLRPLEARTDFLESWLSQAHGTFSQLVIDEDEWGEYCTILGFRLKFEHVGEHETSHAGMDLSEETPIYLFIRPIPRPCDDEERWDSWLREAKYFWSLNPSGVEEMLEYKWLNLGLPMFTTEMEVWHDRWDRSSYDVLEMIHRSQGFERTSTELAIFLGDTILEVAGGKSRFEEVDYDDCYFSPDMNRSTTTDESVSEDSDAVEGDTDDDEVILYPRLNLYL